VNCLGLSSDGQTLVSGTQDKTVKVWRMLEPVARTELSAF
jgi:WD40 repeat protein